MKKLMLTGVGGSKYLFDCPTAENASLVLASAASCGHHAIVNHEGTRVEWGDDDGKTFKPMKVIREGSVANPESVPPA
jgi:hypothetical protein